MTKLERCLMSNKIKQSVAAEQGSMYDSYSFFPYKVTSNYYLLLHVVAIWHN